MERTNYQDYLIKRRPSRSIRCPKLSFNLTTFLIQLEVPKPRALIVKLIRPMESLALLVTNDLRVTDLDLQSDMNIFESILTTFEASVGI